MPTRLEPSPDALARELNGEILILDLRSNHYFGLAGTGARIWQLVEQGLEPPAIADALAAEFEADAAAIARDVSGFLADLVGRGLLVERSP